MSNSTTKSEKLTLLTHHKNGNGTVSIFGDGTRIIKIDGDEFKPEFPLNIDLRISTQCSFGADDDGTPGFCAFCHESAQKNGIHGNVDHILEKLDCMPPGTEIAMGINFPTQPLGRLLKGFQKKEFIVNVTVNQGHVQANQDTIFYWINNNLIKGLGISYRSSVNSESNTWRYINDYPNTIWHVIAGIDNFHDVLKKLPKMGARKVLILGEKDHGFNAGKVFLGSTNHREWRNGIEEIFDSYDVVSFDNLALEQLKIKELFSTKQWEVFYQAEHSMYIDAPHQRFQVSSRTLDRSVNWNTMTVTQYFRDVVRNI